MSETRKHRILCVSRSTTQLDRMMAHLTRPEVEALSASSPEQAVAFCAANHVSAIVLDSEFTTEGGWTVIQSLRMVHTKLPIVLLKADHGDEVPAGVDAVTSQIDLVFGTLNTLLHRPLHHASATVNGVPDPRLFVMHRLDADKNETQAANNGDQTPPHEVAPPATSSEP